jgi:hypothetical protein
LWQDSQLLQLTTTAVFANLRQSALAKEIRTRSTRAAQFSNVGWDKRSAVPYASSYGNGVNVREAVEVEEN